MKLRAKLEIAHINIRREKEGEDEGPVATDLKLIGSFDPATLADLFSTDAGFAYALGSLYREDGELVTHDVETISLAREGIGVAITIDGGLNTKMLFEGADANKIRLKPEPGRVVQLTMRVQIKPTPNQLAQLSQWLGSTIEIDLNQPQTELPLGDVDARFNAQGNGAHAP